ncbi:Tas retrotransposon peptidase A16 [Oesophagostomum dentatum]|uniref:Tas retrotransposon peptidase A16 n=1 Tax=Oesophagostomum dentatum TaxID=61180 RepID=A0A0B1TP13_OESDE|nr:Tas retrotransposon peptidase A16 [Oesophagostomum dentatum]
MRFDYASAKSENEKKNSANEIESIEKETQFNDVLATAKEMNKAQGSGNVISQKQQSADNNRYSGSNYNRRTDEVRQRDSEGSSNYDSHQTAGATARNQTSTPANLELETLPLSVPDKEQIVLTTAEGMVWNHNAEKFEKILFFFDTGAQETVIREDLAAKLGLPEVKNEICIMPGLGGHTETFASNIISIKAGIAYGKELEVLVRTKPIISKGIPSVKLNGPDKEFLEAKQVCVENSKLSGELQNLDVLIGLNYYYNFITENGENLHTPSGFRIAKTIFGPAIYGKGSAVIKDDEKCISYGMTAIMEPENKTLTKLSEPEGEYFQKYSKEISFCDGYITAPFPLKQSRKSQ